eukprot:1165642-Amorphochlora_amoeboformis.AAC.1
MISLAGCFLLWRSSETTVPGFTHIKTGIKENSKKKILGNITEFRVNLGIPGIPKFCAEEFGHNPSDERGERASRGVHGQERRWSAQGSDGGRP